MIIYITGDLLQSSAQALVNTVNCEGYMGKGIAYQFKLKYPEINKQYVKQCKKHEIVPGKLSSYTVDDKIIINFPTKDKWREKSKMEFIATGLDALVKMINQLEIHSIAIPPLGSGNGGLNWNDVKKVISEKLMPISNDVNIYIYEPSHNYMTHATKEPQLSMSALVLMKIKFSLTKFDKIRLQKTAFFMNTYLNEEYFHFTKAQYGPYDNNIDIISKQIKEFQQYHNVNCTEEAYEILMNKLISKNIQEKLEKMEPHIKRAAQITNQYSSDHDVECLATTLYIITLNQPVNENDIVRLFKEWSDDKAKRFTENQIKASIDMLEKTQLAQRSMFGYSVYQQ